MYVKMVIQMTIDCIATLKPYNLPANENGLKWTEMDSFCSYQIQILIF